jgi:hypothetical protein
MELTRFPIEGRVIALRFGPNKKKLLVSTKTPEGVDYYDYDLQFIDRKYYDKPGNLIATN